MAILVAYMSSIFIPTTQMYMYCMNMCLMCNLHIVSQFSHFQHRSMFIEGVLNPRLDYILATKLADTHILISVKLRSC